MLTKIKSMLHLVAATLHSVLPSWPAGPSPSRRDAVDVVVRILAALWWRGGGEQREKR